MSFPLSLALCVVSALCAAACDAQPNDDVTGSPSGGSEQGSGLPTGATCAKAQDCPGYEPPDGCDDVICVEGRCTRTQDGHAPQDGNQCQTVADCDDGDSCTVDDCVGVAYDCHRGRHCTHYHLGYSCVETSESEPDSAGDASTFEPVDAGPEAPSCAPRPFACGASTCDAATQFCDATGEPICGDLLYPNGCASCFDNALPATCVPPLAPVVRGTDSAPPECTVTCE